MIIDFTMTSQLLFTLLLLVEFTLCDQDPSLSGTNELHNSTMQAAAIFTKLMREFDNGEICDKTGSFPIKNECIFYRVCLSPGERAFPGKCPDGQKFDHFRYKCLKGKAQCKNVCKSNGVKFPDPKTVKNFLKCQNGIPLSISCPDGNIYDSKKHACVTGVPPEFEYSDENET